MSLYLTYQLIPSGHILKRKLPSLSPSGSYAVLAAVSSCCPPLQGSFPDTTHPSATRHQQKQAFAMLPFDLHVLSLPPAFNLSHDQTLHYLNSFEFFLNSILSPRIHTDSPRIHTDCLYRIFKELFKRSAPLKWLHIIDYLFTLSNNFLQFFNVFY